MGNILSKNSVEEVDNFEPIETDELVDSKTYIIEGDASNEVNLKILKAKLTSNINWVEDMDPQVKFKYDGHKFRTKTRDGANLRPVWNQIITFYYNEREPQVRIRLKDENDGDDEEIGITTLPLKDVWKTYNDEIKLPLERDGKSAGYLLVTILPPEQVPQKQDYTDKTGKMSKLEKDEETQGLNPNSAQQQGYQPGTVFMSDPRFETMLQMQQQQILMNNMLIMQQQQNLYNQNMINMNAMAMQQQMQQNNIDLVEVEKKEVSQYSESEEEDERPMVYRVEDFDQDAGQTKQCFSPDEDKKDVWRLVFSTPILEDSQALEVKFQYQKADGLPEDAQPSGEIAYTVDKLPWIDDYLKTGSDMNNTRIFNYYQQDSLYQKKASENYAHKFEFRFEKDSTLIKEMAGSKVFRIWHQCGYGRRTSFRKLQVTVFGAKIGQPPSNQWIEKPEDVSKSRILKHQFIEIDQYGSFSKPYQTIVTNSFRFTELTALELFQQARGGEFQSNQTGYLVITIDSLETIRQGLGFNAIDQEGVLLRKQCPPTTPQWQKQRVSIAKDELKKLKMEKFFVIRTWLYCGGDGHEFHAREFKLQLNQSMYDRKI